MAVGSKYGGFMKGLNSVSNNPFIAALGTATAYGRERHGRAQDQMQKGWYQIENLENQERQEMDRMGITDPDEFYSTPKGMTLARRWEELANTRLVKDRITEDREMLDPEGRLGFRVNPNSGKVFLTGRKKAEYDPNQSEVPLTDTKNDDPKGRIEEYSSTGMKDLIKESFAYEMGFPTSHNQSDAIDAYAKASNAGLGMRTPSLPQTNAGAFSRPGQVRSSAPAAAPAAAPAGPVTTATGTGPGGEPLHNLPPVDVNSIEARARVGSAAAPGTKLSDTTKAYETDDSFVGQTDQHTKKMADFAEVEERENNRAALIDADGKLSFKNFGIPDSDDSLQLSGDQVSSYKYHGVLDDVDKEGLGRAKTAFEDRYKKLNEIHEQATRDRDDELRDETLTQMSQMLDAFEPVAKASGMKLRSDGPVSQSIINKTPKGHPANFNQNYMSPGEQGYVMDTAMDTLRNTEKALFTGPGKTGDPFFDTNRGRAALSSSLINMGFIPKTVDGLKAAGMFTATGKFDSEPERNKKFLNQLHTVSKIDDLKQKQDLALAKHNLAIEKHRAGMLKEAAALEKASRQGFGKISKEAAKIQTDELNNILNATFPNFEGKGLSPEGRGIQSIAKSLIDPGSTTVDEIDAIIDTNPRFLEIYKGVDNKAGQEHMRANLRGKIAAIVATFRYNNPSYKDVTPAEIMSYLQKEGKLEDRIDWWDKNDGWSLLYRPVLQALGGQGILDFFGERLPDSLRHTSYAANNSNMTPMLERDVGALATSRTADEKGINSPIESEQLTHDKKRALSR